MCVCFEQLSCSCIGVTLRSCGIPELVAQSLLADATEVQDPVPGCLVIPLAVYTQHGKCIPGLVVEKWSQVTHPPICFHLDLFHMYFKVCYEVLNICVFCHGRHPRSISLPQSCFSVCLLSFFVLLSLLSFSFSPRSFLLASPFIFLEFAYQLLLSTFFL